MVSFDYKKYMQLALQQAEKSAEKNEVPVGAIITNAKGDIIAKAHNLSENSNDITEHAEIVAIRGALKKLKDENANRLEGCNIYVTLEPCPMCAQAISFARISKLIYGAADIKGGGVENGAKIFHASSCHHKPEVINGIMSEECAEILREFFKEKRNL